MSAIDMDNQEPFFIKIKINGATITQLVRPTTVGFEETSDSVEAYDPLGKKVARFITSRNLETNLTFSAVTMPGTDCFARIKVGD
jgi:hypothetical protein